MMARDVSGSLSPCFSRLVLSRGLSMWSGSRSFLSRRSWVSYFGGLSVFDQERRRFSVGSCTGLRQSCGSCVPVVGVCNSGVVLRNCRLWQCSRLLLRLFFLCRSVLMSGAMFRPSREWSCYLQPFCRSSCVSPAWNGLAVSKKINLGSLS